VRQDVPAIIAPGRSKFDMAIAQSKLRKRRQCLVKCHLTPLSTVTDTDALGLYIFHLRRAQVRVDSRHETQPCSHQETIDAEEAIAFLGVCS
jgi:hypothetical protein